jgi:hypothetical protein
MDMCSFLSLGGTAPPLDHEHPPTADTILSAA